MPRLVRRPTARPLIAVSAVVLAPLLALTGCAAAGPEPSRVTEDAAQLELHPTGDPGTWFSVDYAAGVAGTFATSNTVCGIGDGYLIETLTGTDGQELVQARGFDGGAVQWVVPDARCEEGSLQDGTLLAYSTLTPTPLDESDLEQWLFVDAATGAEAQRFRLEGARSSATLLGRAGDLRIVDAHGRLYGVGPDASASGAAWSASVSGFNTLTPLADGMIGLSGPNSRAAILDGNTGETRLELEPTESQDLTWASDGYAVRINQSDPEYAFYDLDGEEVDRTTGTSQYPFVPPVYRGVTFSIDDHVKAGTVVGVDRSGRPALWEGAGAQDYSRTGEIELPDSIIGARGVSADGSLFLFDAADDGNLALIDDAGNEVFAWPVPQDELLLESAYIATVQDGTTTVLLPRTEDQ